MTFHFDINKSLNDLEGVKWEEPNFDSHLVNTCHKLRGKPLKAFTVENLRIMIGQAIGLKYLVPLALEKLEKEPFAGGDYGPGDLLQGVLKLKSDFWGVDPALWSRAKKLVDHAMSKLNELDPLERDKLQKELKAFKEK